MAEQETKLSAPSGFQMPDLAGPDDGFLADPQPTRRYTTVYWDTPDLRLARWGATLRHRGDEGWTVKLPADEGGALLVGDVRFHVCCLLLSAAPVEPFDAMVAASPATTLDAGWEKGGSR